MDELTTTLDAPVWLRSELLANGHCDRELAVLTKAGLLRRVRRGAYADGATYDAASQDEQHALLVRAVVRQAKTQVVPSHHSALPFHGISTWRMPLTEVHVTRPDGCAGRSEAGVRQHRGVLLEGDVSDRHGLLITSATRTALDVTTCGDTEAGLVAVNQLLHRKLTTHDALRARYEPMARHPNTLRTDLVLRLADRRLESVGETRTFFLMYRQGIPAPQPQFEIWDRGRELARLDFAWPELNAWLEFDGREKYVVHRRVGETLTDAVLREKRRESMVSELTGWRCMRITWADLERSNRTAARIAAFLKVAPRVPTFT